MQPFDQEVFVKYLRDRNLAPERNIPYYVKWVHRFMAAPLPPVATSPQDLLQAFDNLLSKDQAVQEWQLRQALRAAELYLKVFSASDPASGRPLEKETAISEAERACAQMRELIRLRHYSYRTEQTYLDWTRRYMTYALQHTLDWRESDTVKAYLSSLATVHDVAASTQNQAFSALLFLLREVMKQELPDLKSVRARRGIRLPVVLSVEEVRRVLQATPPEDRVLLQLAYGAGLRVSELIRLRIKDLDFDNQLLLVRDGKGTKDRATLLPKKLFDPLKNQIARVKLLKGVNIREVQKYLGHESVETTMIYTHVIRGMDSTAESPLDEL